MEPPPPVIRITSYNVCYTKLLRLPFDESKISDPKLIFYTPIRICNGAIVVTNGDHTETVCESLLAGHSFQYAMSARCYEPDAPNYTPRIAGLMLPTGRYTLSIVKKMTDADDCRRKYWSFDTRITSYNVCYTKLLRTG